MTIIPTFGTELCQQHRDAPLFHFLGNSTLGYIQTESMFGWLQAVYEGGAKQGRDDELGMMIPG